MPMCDPGCLFVSFSGAEKKEEEASSLSCHYFSLFLPLSSPSPCISSLFSGGDQEEIREGEEAATEKRLIGEGRLFRPQERVCLCLDLFSCPNYARICSFSAFLKILA